MLCIRCARPTKVLKTLVFERYTARERQCRECFHRYLSLEMPTDDIGNFEHPQVARDLKLGGRHPDFAREVPAVEAPIAPPVQPAPVQFDRNAPITPEMLDARMRELGVK